MPKIYTIKDMQEYAADYGGRCLSKEYIDLRSHLKWQCEKGHTWDADFRIIQQGGWCKQCSKYNNQLQELKSIAKERGGLCLSEIYVNSATRVLWQCKKGHKWLAKPTDVKNRGNWCRKCAGLAPLTLDDMKLEAAKHDGKCLSKEYINSRTPLQWECKKGHTWYVAVAGIRKNGTWCPKCAGLERLTLEDMIKAAKQKGGKCLSDKYINSSTPLKWECAKGHQWYANGNYVRNNDHWCPICGGTARLTLKHATDAATKNGGKCLSDKYINGRTKMKWQCALGHIWMANLNHIRDRGDWCPTCSYRKRGEKRRGNLDSYKAIIEKKGGKLFTKNFINSHMYLSLQCKEGHKWKTKAYSITQGRWCPYCACKIKQQNLPTLKKYKS